MTLQVPAGPMLADSPLLIGGEWVTSSSAGHLDHHYPATGRVDARVVLAGREEVDAAVAAARAAAPGWQAVPPEGRRSLLMKLADIIEEHADEFTRMTTLEMGVPTAFAQWNAATAAQWFRYYAGWADKLEGSVIPLSQASGLDYTMREPYGVVGLLTAWNAPLIFIGMKAGPALAAGNTVVLKPSELAPFTSIRFAELALAAGLPAGVINVVPGGPDAGEAMVRHPGIDKISLTGSVPTARKVIEASSSTIKPLALELGGKSANIVMPDADLDKATQLAALVGIGIMSGQGCACGTRLLVHESVHDEVLMRLQAIIEQYTAGDPFAATTVIGPLVTAASQKRVLGIINEAIESDAAHLVVGGQAPGGELAEGYFVQPTVFDNVAVDSELAQTEIFGPVLSVLTFTDLDDAVRIANATDFGLGAFVNSRDVNTVHTLARRLKAGSVWVNDFPGMSPGAPFGGYGVSGYGREGGKAGIEEYLRTKNVFISHE